MVDRSHKAEPIFDRIVEARKVLPCQFLILARFQVFEGCYFFFLFFFERRFNSAAGFSLIWPELIQRSEIGLRGRIRRLKCSIWMGFLSFSLPGFPHLVFTLCVAAAFVKLSKARNELNSLVLSLLHTTHTHADRYICTHVSVCQGYISHLSINEDRGRNWIKIFASMIWVHALV